MDLAFFAMKSCTAAVLAVLLLAGCAGKNKKIESGRFERPDPVQVTRNGYSFVRPPVHWREQKPPRMDGGYALRDHAVQILIDGDSGSVGRNDPIKAMKAMIRSLRCKEIQDRLDLEPSLSGVTTEATFLAELVVSRRDSFQVQRRIRIAIKVGSRRWAGVAYLAPPLEYGLAMDEFEALVESIDLGS